MNWTIRVTYTDGDSIEVFFVDYGDALRVYFKQIDLAFESRLSVIKQIELLCDGKVEKKATI